MGIEMAGTVKNLHSKEELDSTVKKQGSVVVLHFWASWCEPSAAMEPVFAQLAADAPNAQFFRVEAEEQAEISEAYDVAAVPLFMVIKDGVVVAKMQGANAPELATLVAKWAAEPTAAATPPPPAAAARERLHQLVTSHPLMLFMKGTPEAPKCGFSRKVVDVLAATGAAYGSFDILGDDAVRQGMKEYANWPTFPQLYAQGELLGGCDIVLEMDKSGELKEVLAEKGLLPKEDLDARLKGLIESAPTMLFMKGTPDAPRCGFSGKVVDALKAEGVEFGSFNILEDEDVRAGLKAYSNWPTFPQLYHKGELLGGCDIVLEMKASGELKSALTE